MIAPPCARHALIIASVAWPSSTLPLRLTLEDAYDPFGLRACATQLMEEANVVDAADDAIANICGLHERELVPHVPALYMRDMPRSERMGEIIKISFSLDRLECAARGPMLAGGAKVTRADATIFPNMVLLKLTLPVHFGWTEWTDEAIFWRRPRLDAWYELMKYEKAAKAVEAAITSKLEEEIVDWGELALDVPTSHLRTFPKHAL